MTVLKKIYLAGFDVFRQDAAWYGKEMQKLCEKYGFEGLYPLDNTCTAASGIFEANTEMIRRCDIIAANMNDFRGSEPDSGTAFELGYGYALGKTLYCYRSDIRTLRQRLGCTDADGFNVEDFGLSLNLMIAVPSVVVKGGFEDCLKQIKDDISQ